MMSGRTTLRALEGRLKRVAGASLRHLPGSARTTQHPPGSAPRILVIRQHNQLGDMLCVVPLLRALRSHRPDAWISLMASPVNNDVMLNNRYLDEVTNFDKRLFSGRGGFHIVRFVNFIRTLRKKRFDIAIVPSTVSTSFTSDLLAYLSGAGMRIGVGSTNGKANPSGFFFNFPAHLDWAAEEHRHQTLRNLDVLPSWITKPEDLTIEITLTEDEVQWGNVFVSSELRPNIRRIAFHPGAGKPPNRWPAHRFAIIADSLGVEFQADLYITHGPMDDEAVKSMQMALTRKVQCIENQSIRRVASILRNMDLVVTNDTGIMHVAAAAGASVLSLFGPTDPRQWAPIGERNRYLQGEGGDVEMISVEEVLRNAREMLLRDRSGGKR